MEADLESRHYPTRRLAHYKQQMEGAVCQFYVFNAQLQSTDLPATSPCHTELNGLHAAWTVVLRTLQGEAAELVGPVHASPDFKTAGHRKPASKSGGLEGHSFPVVLFAGRQVLASLT